MRVDSSDFVGGHAAFFNVIAGGGEGVPEACCGTFSRVGGNNGV